MTHVTDGWSDRAGGHAAAALRPPARAPLIALCLALGVSGCGASAEELATEDLQARLDGVHGGFLERRAQDPALAGEAAQQALDEYGYSVETLRHEDSITFVRTIDASAFTGGGLSCDQVDLGACLLVTVAYGSGSDLGSGTPEPVACPAGTDLPGDRTVELDGAVGRRRGLGPRPRPLRLHLR